MVVVIFGTGGFADSMQTCGLRCSDFSESMRPKLSLLKPARCAQACALKPNDDSEAPRRFLKRIEAREEKLKPQRKQPKVPWKRAKLPRNQSTQCSTQPKVLLRSTNRCVGLKRCMERCMVVYGSCRDALLVLFPRIATIANDIELLSDNFGQWDSADPTGR